MATFTQRPTGTDTSKTPGGLINIKATEKALDSSGVISEARLTFDPNVAQLMHLQLGKLLGIDPPDADRIRKLEDAVGLRNEEIALLKSRLERRTNTVLGMKRQLVRLKGELAAAQPFPRAEILERAKAIQAMAARPLLDTTTSVGIVRSAREILAALDAGETPEDPIPPDDVPAEHAEETAREVDGFIRDGYGVKRIDGAIICVCARREDAQSIVISLNSYRRSP